MEKNVYKQTLRQVVFHKITIPKCRQYSTLCWYKNQQVSVVLSHHLSIREWTETICDTVIPWATVQQWTNRLPCWIFHSAAMTNPNQREEGRICAHDLRGFLLSSFGPMHLERHHQTRTTENSNNIMVNRKERRETGRGQGFTSSGWVSSIEVFKIALLSGATSSTLEPLVEPFISKP